MSEQDALAFIIIIFVVVIIMCTICCERNCREERSPIYSSPIVVTSETHQVPGSSHTVQHSSSLPQQNIPIPFTGAYPATRGTPQTYRQPSPGRSSPYNPVMTNTSQNIIIPSAPYMNNPDDDLPPSYSAATVMKPLPR